MSNFAPTFVRVFVSCGRLARHRHCAIAIVNGCSSCGILRPDLLEGHLAYHWTQDAGPHDEVARHRLALDGQPVADGQRLERVACDPNRAAGIDDRRRQGPHRRSPLFHPPGKFTSGQMFLHEYLM
jgi:hypothetical protein